MGRRSMGGRHSHLATMLVTGAMTVTMGVIPVTVSPPHRQPRLPEQQGPLCEQGQQAVGDHPQQRERRDQPQVVEDAVHHLRIRSSVMSIVSLSRYRAISSASPTAASAAATVITMKAKIPPVTSPRYDPAATNATLTPFSMSSTLIRMISTFFRATTPTTPMQNRIAERSRYADGWTILPPLRPSSSP